MFLANRLISPVICIASSLVGAIITPCIPAFGVTNCNIGSVYAAVLPVPVCA